MTIKLIIGLQNPGAAYEPTRHNAGAWFVESLIAEYGLSLKTESKLHGRIALFEKEGNLCRLLLPTTYMNHSGLAARATSQFYRIESNEILVVHDELDLDPGRIKLKSGGGHGGHNGLRDTIQQLGNNHFHRLRIGIGHPGDKSLVLNYVLGKPSVSDKKNIMEAINRSLPILPRLIQGDLAYAMNHINT